MRVVEPTRLAVEAANALGPFHRDVVVVGATAIELALADRHIAIAPTRDVDVVVAPERANALVERLEHEGFTRSAVPHETAFTWERDDVKVQLVRTFHPFVRGAARRLPVNSAFGMATDPANSVTVAFEAEPTIARLTCATPLCLVALKQAAFGRRRAGSDGLVLRDYHDVHLLFRHCRDALVRDFERATSEVRRRALSAAETLATDDEALAAAAREGVAVGAESVRAAEVEIRRTAERMLRRLRQQP